MAASYVADGLSGVGAGPTVQIYFPTHSFTQSSTL